MKPRRRLERALPESDWGITYSPLKRNSSLNFKTKQNKVETNPDLQNKTQNKDSANSPKCNWCVNITRPTYKHETHNVIMQRQKSIIRIYGSTESNKCRCLRLISSSAFQVAFSIEWCLQITFTEAISLFSSLLTWRSTILIGTSSYGKSDLSSTECGAKTCDGSGTYFLRSKTWNTGQTEANWGDNTNW